MSMYVHIYGDSVVFTKRFIYAVYDTILIYMFYYTILYTGDKLVTIQQMLQPVMRLLHDNDCVPSLDVLGKIAD